MNARGRIIVLMPSRGTVAAETMLALLTHNEGYELVFRMATHLPVDAARNRLAAKALEAAEDRTLFPTQSDPYVFWIDADAFFLTGTFTMMIRTLEEHPNIDLLSALTGPRVPHEKSYAQTRYDDAASGLRPGVDCEAGAVVEVELVSAHFLCHRASLLRRVGSGPPFGPPDFPITEDIYFSRMVRVNGGRIAVATGIPVFHVDERNGHAFLPTYPAARIEDDGTLDAATPVNPLAPDERTYGDRVDSVVRRNRERRDAEVSPPE
jgi:hypothetical protein